MRLADGIRCADTYLAAYLFWRSDCGVFCGAFGRGRVNVRVFVRAFQKELIIYIINTPRTISFIRTFSRKFFTELMRIFIISSGGPRDTKIRRQRNIQFINIRCVFPVRHIIDCWRFRQRLQQQYHLLKTLNMAANAYCLENPSGSFYGNDAAELSSALAVEVKESKNLRYWGEVNCNNSLHPIVFGARLQPNALDLWLNAKTGRRSCSGSGCEKIGFALSTSDSNICIRGANCGVSTCYAEGSGCGSSCGSSSCGSSCGA